MNEMVWIWFVVLIAALVLEFITVDFVSMWFAIAAVPIIVIAWIWPELIYLQVILFFVIGFLLMILTRPLLVRYFRKNVVSTNVDSYIGKEAIVKELITPTKNGTVLFESLIWTAVSKEEISPNTLVKILAVEGNKLIVSKIK
ncbi:MAG: NfeD family protein [Acholeplasmataceae bacterium]